MSICHNNLMDQDSMAQYSKFEYRDFRHNTGPIISSPKTKDFQKQEEAVRDQIITEVVQEHLSESLPAFEFAPETIPEIVPFEFASETMPEIVSLEPDSVTPNVDLDRIKNENYKLGYAAAEAALAPQLAKIRDNEMFISLLQSKLEAVSPVINIPDQMFDMVANIIAVMAKKLQLMIPADFEAIILGQMAPILTKYYKNGAIMIYVNPERVDYCNNLVKMNELPSNIADNIKIISDEAISHNDCKIEWQDAMLQYNQAELVLEIEKILAHLEIENK